MSAIDGRKLLALLAAGALAYAARDVLLDLSLTVTAALLLLAVVACFVVAGRLPEGPVETLAFALAGLTTIAFGWFVVVRYAPGLGRTALLLAVAAVLFAVLWVPLRSWHVRLSRRRAVRLGVGLLAVAALLVYADATTPDVRLLFAPIETVTVPPVATEGPLPHSTTQQRIGTVTAANPSPFTRVLALPSLSGCLAATATTPSEAVHVSYGPTGTAPPNALAGGTTRQFAVYANLPGAVDRVDPQGLRVTQGTDCDAERDAPTLVVTVRMDTAAVPDASDAIGSRL